MFSHKVLTLHTCFLVLSGTYAPVESLFPAHNTGAPSAPLGPVPCNTFCCTPALQSVPRHRSYSPFETEDFAALRSFSAILVAAVCQYDTTINTTEYCYSHTMTPKWRTAATFVFVFLQNGSEALGLFKMTLVRNTMKSSLSTPFCWCLQARFVFFIE